MEIKDIVRNAINEDLKDPSGKIPFGDHSANSCISENEKNRAKLIVKDSGILAGVDIAIQIFETIDKDIKFVKYKSDSEMVEFGDIAFEVYGNARNLLKAERIVLNIMQRMSGIATKTNSFVQKIKNTNCKLLDTRKTTPNFRVIEKMAVKIGGGNNHRFGLYDMIMIKDNHVDFVGSISKAIKKCIIYKKENSLDIPIEIETKNIMQVNEVLEVGGVDRIMLDNFSIQDCKMAVNIVKNKIPLEASGGINIDNIEEYANTGVNYVSVGSLTYSYKSLDLSLKAF